MQSDYWQQRWDENRIGFHLNEVNPYLVKYWSQLHLPTQSRVFVPMCGKSHDMRWLLEQGYQVEACELVPKAVEEFFVEQQLAFECYQHEQWRLYEGERIRIWCGDYFQLSPLQLQAQNSASTLRPIAAVYDRASLVAMPEQMRADYLMQLMQLVGSIPQFLVTMEYEQSQMDGPPFNVGEQEVINFYRNYYDLSKMTRYCAQVIDENPNMLKRGLTALTECVYLLQVHEK